MNLRDSINLAIDDLMSDSADYPDCNLCEWNNMCSFASVGHPCPHSDDLFTEE